MMASNISLTSRYPGVEGDQSAVPAKHATVYGHQVYQGSDYGTAYIDEPDMTAFIATKQTTNCITHLIVGLLCCVAVMTSSVPPITTRAFRKTVSPPGIQMSRRAQAVGVDRYCGCRTAQPDPLTLFGNTRVSCCGMHA